jgi:hypothetical protein
VTTDGRATPYDIVHANGACQYIFSAICTLKCFLYLANVWARRLQQILHILPHAVFSGVLCLFSLHFL